MPTTIEGTAIGAPIFQRLHPKIYLERFISEDVRPDGREFGAWRDISVNVGKVALDLWSWFH
jgi:exosome complex component RRP43